jgi:glycosyltransferase involved in cell wall biosynthesis
VSRSRLCHVFPAFSTGGPEVRTAVVIERTLPDFRHTVISLNGDLSGRTRIEGARHVRFVAAPQVAGRFRRPLALRQLVREQSADLVLTYGWGGIDALLAARLCGIRRVVHTEDGFLPDEALRQKFTRLMARRVALRSASRLIVISRRLVGIARELWRLPDRLVRYLPNGVDTDRFSPASQENRAIVRRQLGIEPDEVVIGTVAMLRPEKNQSRLLRAFASAGQSRKARLLLVGDGPLRDSLERQARELGVADRVLITGVVQDTAPYYRAMDIFALSSDTEQMPLSVLEAIGTGLPVVSTDVGDVRDMVSAPNRRLITERDRSDAYRRALEELMDQPALRAELVLANREKCLQEFSEIAMVNAYRDVYREVIESVA